MHYVAVYLGDSWSAVCLVVGGIGGTERIDMKSVHISASQPVSTWALAQVHGWRRCVCCVGGVGGDLGRAGAPATRHPCQRHRFLALHFMLCMSHMDMHPYLHPHPFTVHPPPPNSPHSHATIQTTTMAGAPGPIRRAWYQWKMQRFPWRKKWLVGECASPKPIPASPFALP